MAAPLPAIRPLRWQPTSQSSPQTISNRSREDFEAAVEQGRDHIATITNHVEKTCFWEEPLQGYDVKTVGGCFIT